MAQVLQAPFFAQVRHPITFTANLAVINKLSFLCSYAAIIAGLKIRVTILTKSALLRFSEPYIGFHSNLSCQKDVALRQFWLYLVNIFSQVKQMFNPFFCNQGLLPAPNFVQLFHYFN